MKIWRIKEPEYASRREEKYNNGTVEFQYQLPGVICCTTWAGFDLLALECPVKLRDLRELNDPSPVTPEALESLRSSLREHPGFQSLTMLDLKPGMSLLPPRFKPPKVQENDFLWPALGVLVISQRIASSLGAFCPRDFREVAIPENDDWFLVDIRKRTLPPIERRSDGVCPKCGRLNKVSEPTDLVIFEDMIPKADIYMLDTTLQIMISDNLKLLLEDIGARNVVFDPIPIQKGP